MLIGTYESASIVIPTYVKVTNKFLTNKESSWLQLINFMLYLIFN
jgi:hypothetical protein